MNLRAEHVLPVLGLVALASVAGLNSRARAAKEYAPVYTTGEIERAAVNSTSLAMILGEVRTNIADFIWIKTELYSHRGLKFKPHEDETESLDASELQGKGQKPNKSPPKAHDHTHEDGHEHEHGDDVPQWIPSEGADFRGFIGKIQREVQPYGAHEFAQGSQILPWYRVQTAVNPRQGRAYVVAGWLLLKEDQPDGSNLKQAEQYLLEGAENNPDFFPIRVMLGRVLLEQKRYDDAIANFEIARDLALKRRTPDGKAAPPEWEDSDEEDFGFAVRYIPYIQFRMLNDLESAEQTTLAGLKLLPTDQPLRNFLKLIRHAKESGASGQNSDTP